MWKVEYKAKPGQIFNFPHPDDPEIIISLKNGDLFECRCKPDFKGPGISIIGDGVTQAKSIEEKVEEKKELEVDRVDDSKEDKKEKSKPEEKLAEKKAKKKKKKNKGVGGKRIQ